MASPWQQDLHDPTPEERTRNNKGFSLTPQILLLKTIFDFPNIYGLDLLLDIFFYFNSHNLAKCEN
jgi:hypothetical protein